MTRSPEVKGQCKKLIHPIVVTHPPFPGILSNWPLRSSYSLCFVFGIPFYARPYINMLLKNCMKYKALIITHALCVCDLCDLLRGQGVEYLHTSKSRSLGYGEFWRISKELTVMTAAPHGFAVYTFIGKEHCLPPSVTM